MRVNGRVLWLWCWFGVLVASCSQQSVSSPAAQTATLALLGLTQTAITPTPTLWLFPSPTVSSLIAVTLAPTPLPLPVTPPTCYELPVSGAICLGMIRNILGLSVDSVAVRVYLVSADGVPLAQCDAAIARIILPPGEMSPYVVTFDKVPPDAVGPVAVLTQARYANAQSATGLTVREVRSTFLEGYFRVSGMLVNPGSARADQISVVVTLLDGRDRVVGFRQTVLPDSVQLAPGQRREFSIDVIPVIPRRPVDTRYEVGVDARLN